MAPRKKKPADDKHTKGGVADQAIHTDTLSLVECPAGNGSLAKKKSKEGNPGRFLVRARIFRKRLIDSDNISIKGILDCFRYAEILPDDRESDLILQIAQQVKVKKDEDERVEVTIYPPGSVEANEAEAQIIKENQRYDQPTN